jgi:K+-transporting ATPase KdpF subunit
LGVRKVYRIPEAGGCGAGNRQMVFHIPLDLRLIEPGAANLYTFFTRRFLVLRKSIRYPAQQACAIFCNHLPWVSVMLVGNLLCEVKHGHSVHRTRCRFRGPEHRAGERLRKIDEEAEMSGIYILSGLVAAAILVYLFVALLWPEKF